MYHSLDRDSGDCEWSWSWVRILFWNFQQTLKQIEKNMIKNHLMINESKQTLQFFRSINLCVIEHRYYPLFLFRHFTFIFSMNHQFCLGVTCAFGRSLCFGASALKSFKLLTYLWTDNSARQRVGGVSHHCVLKSEKYDFA